ncbi:MAG: hemolysin III family protein [Clostridia bacterium]
MYNKTRSTVAGWTIFGIIWAFAILGIVLNAIDIKKFKVFSMICYLAMGWCIILKVNLLPSTLGMSGFILLVAGGVAYTIGAILYGVGKKHKYMHSVFHLFILYRKYITFLVYIIICNVKMKQLFFS